MEYKVYYSDIWETDETPVVNEWIYLKNLEIEKDFKDEELINMFIEDNTVDNYEIDDSGEIFYILRDGIAIIKLEPDVRRNFSE